MITLSRLIAAATVPQGVSFSAAVQVTGAVPGERVRIELRFVESNGTTWDHGQVLSVNPDGEGEIACDLTPTVTGEATLNAAVLLLDRPEVTLPVLTTGIRVV